MYCITKWCKAITDDHKDQYTHRLSKMKQKLIDKYGSVPTLYRFRLIDSDDEVYAYGIGTDNSSFAPLDKYEPLYGCTDIQYKNPETGIYESL